MRLGWEEPLKPSVIIGDWKVEFCFSEVVEDGGGWEEFWELSKEVFQVATFEALQRDFQLLWLKKIER